MKVRQVYENALALDISFIDQEDDLEFFAIKILNMILCEVFAHNNQIRLKKDLKPLSDVAVVNSINDDINYEKELYAPICYALASKLLLAQEEFNMAALYNNQYITLLQMVTPILEIGVD